MDINYQTPGGATIKITVPDDATEEEVNSILNAEADAADRQERVTAGATRRLDAELNEGVSGAINQGEARWPLAMLSEAGRNFGWDVPANLEGAGVMGGDAYEGGPRDFYERRDAARVAQDMYTEQSGLPSAVDHTVSALGAIFAPDAWLKIGKLPRWAQAINRGAQEGAVSGVLEGDAESGAEMAGQAAGGAGAGGAGGAVVDRLGRTLSKAYQRFAGDEDTQIRYDQQKALGMEPTTGSIGNTAAAGMENNRANALLSGPRLLSKAIPDAKNKQHEQWKVLTQTYNQAMKEVDPNFRPVAAEEFAQMAGGDIQAAQIALKDERALIGDRIEDVVPGDTPVNTRLIEEVPDYLRSQGRTGLAGEAEGYMGRTLMQNPATVIDDPLYRAQSAKFDEVRTQRDTLATSIENMKEKRAALVNDPSAHPMAARQASAMETYIKDAEGQLAKMDQEIADVQGRIRNNRTRTFGDVKDFRTGVGRKADQGGPSEYVADTFNEASTLSMLEAAPPEFKALNDQFRENYADHKVIGKYFKDKNSSVFGTLRTAFKGGNVDVLDALEKHLDPEDWRAMRAGLIDQMARGQKGDASLIRFSDTYGQMGDPMRRRLAGSDEAKAILDSLSTVLKGMGNQVSEQNFSQSGRHIEASGFLATVLNNWRAALNGLTAGGATDTAISSKALTAALAGRPNDLNELISRGLTREFSRQENAGIPGTEAADENIREPIEGKVEEALQ